jgi:hypothetical protein
LYKRVIYKIKHVKFVNKVNWQSGEEKSQNFNKINNHTVSKHFFSVQIDNVSLLVVMTEVNKTGFLILEVLILVLGTLVNNYFKVFNIATSARIMTLSMYMKYTC